MRDVLTVAVIAALVAVSCGAPPDVDDAGDAAVDSIVDDTGPDAFDPDVFADVPLDVAPADAADTADDSPADVATDSTSEIPEPVVLFDLSEVGDIHDMWGSPETSVWAVGADGLVLVLRGGQFVPAPLPPTSVDLFGVGGSGGAVYVVGAAGTVLRWRDGAWEDLDCPATKDLLSVSCPSPDECWAVGRGGTIAHLVDGAWELQDAGVTWDLFGVLSEEDDGTWIVGAFGSLFELSESGWDSSQIAGSVSSIRDIYRAPDGTLVAVGSRGTIVMRKAGATRWDQQLTNDTWEPGRDLFAVTGRSATDMWAFGDSGAILHFDGTRWELMTVAGPSTVLADFRGACVADWLSDPESDEGFIVAGGMASAAASLDAEEEVWVDMSAGPTSDLNAVWVHSPGADPSGERAVFVGAGGLALEFAGGRFGLLETGIESDFRAIADGVAVGDAGVVGLFTVDEVDGAFSVVPVVSSTVEDLSDVFGDDDGWVFVGAEGSVFQMDESLTPSFVGQVSGVLTSVCRNEAGLFVGGEAGLLAFMADGGGTFADVVTFTQSAVRDIAPLGDGRVVAVGDNGIILVCDATLCEKIFSEPTSFLYTVGGNGDLPVFTAGWAGVILEYDGSAVRSIESGTYRVFSGLDAAAGGGRVFLAGDGGFAAILDPALVPAAD